jgi:hypothetical protein
MACAGPLVSIFGTDAQVEGILNEILLTRLVLARST